MENLIKLAIFLGKLALFLLKKRVNCPTSPSKLVLAETSALASSSTCSTGRSCSAWPTWIGIEILSLTLPDRLMLYYRHGSLNVPIEHHPTIMYMVYNGYYKVMSNISKMGQLPTPDRLDIYYRYTINTIYNIYL